MSDHVELSKPLIAPVYSQTEANQPIALGREAVEFEHEGTTYRKTADVRMRFVPDSRLQFIVPSEDKNPLLGMRLISSPRDDLKLTLTDRSIPFDGFVAAVGDKHGGIVFSPKQSAITVTPPSSAISTAKFHLFNFPEFRAPEDYFLQTGEPPLQGSMVCGCVVLKTDDWRITVAATDRTSDLVEGLRAQGGYALTHVGQIVREDKTTFASEQLDDVLSCLHYFLSFVLGRWAGLSLPIGFDRDGKRVFEWWGMGRCAAGRWNASCSWWDTLYGQWLSEVFRGFVSLWKKPLWRQPLTHVLYWYVQACDPSVRIGVDTGLVLAQAALELLAWTYCVQERKMVSAAAFKRGKLAAADKLRLLASSLNIPREIPSHLSALYHRQGKPWDDTMHAITSIRNSLVHPDSQLSVPDSSFYEARNLSLWYIDLVLLHLCGYSGKYSNRLARGVRTVDFVPWAQDAADTA
ncbi:MAG: hypothetical protein NTW96_20555 [Planctomycetia bacterium]|nr:hypothetical protein [Planctomycetia bacterium]